MNDEARSVHVGHRDYYLQLAEEADAAWRTGQHEHWLERLDIDADNFRAALEWSKSQPDDTAALTRLTVALARYWEFTGRFTEARQWVADALAEQAPPEQRIRALIAGAQLASYLADFAAADSLLNEGRDLAKQHEDRHGEALTSTYRGHVALTRGDFPGAVAAHLDGLARWRDLGDHEQVADSLNQLGMAVLLQGDLPTAGERLEEALTLCRTVDTPFHLADALQALGFVRFLMGDPTAALPLLAEGLTLFHRLGAQAQIATGLDEYAFVTGTLGHPMESARLLGAAAALRQRIGIPRPAAYDHFYEQLLSGLRAVLGADALREAMASGGELRADEAVALATAFSG